MDAAVAVADADSAATARDLAGFGIPAGPCGGASVAGARAALTGDGAEPRRAALDLRPDATVDHEDRRSAGQHETGLRDIHLAGVG